MLNAQTYQDLWGIDPKTGRPYDVAERRAQMYDMGIRGNVGGPLPSKQWDEYSNRVNYRLSGLPDDFNAYNYGAPGSKGWSNIHSGLVKAAGKREAEFTGGTYNPAENSASSFNQNPHFTQGGGLGQPGGMAGKIMQQPMLGLKKARL